MEVLLSLLVIFITTAIFLWSCKFRRARGNSETVIVSQDGEVELSSSPCFSSPSSPRKNGFEHDVFLSFRGADTRKGFTGHLHQALKEKGVVTFLDSEKLEKGQKVEELFGHIERSKIFVPIFSKGYADSQWCLKEIAKMAECRRLIVPVFFDVEPRDVRHQSGPFSSAFKRHSKKGEVDMEEVSRWRVALKESGEISGYNLADTQGNEAKLIQLIVKRILTEVNKTSQLFVAKHPVGLDSRIADLMKVLDIEAQNDVRMVGIHGMGGMGKTTLAKAVYNQIRCRFDACCFLSNVREAAKQSSGLIPLQKQLLLDVLGDENVNFSIVDEGIGIIKQRTRNKKVLLVLDDVDDESELDALAGNLDWFSAGSRTIITTREKRVLKAPRVKQNDVFELKGLDATQSLQLFSWHAFGKKEPNAKFVELSMEVSATAAGLPLALAVFGSHFFDLKTVKEWTTMLEKLKEDQDKHIHEGLKISYDALDRKEKKVFLDIACFFVGKGTWLPSLMWEDCSFFPDITIKVLVHKSLVSINHETDTFEMHDHIRDMGRKIAEGESISNPGMCSSRLWKNDETLDVLQNKRGTRNLEAIELIEYLDGIRILSNKFLRVRTESFAAMSQLRMLTLVGVTLEGGYEHIPRTVRWLHWVSPDLDFLPSSLCLDNIVILDLSYSWITQVWNQQGFASIKVFTKLRVLYLHDCRKLISCPDFRSMPQLEYLDLRDCRGMRELHPSIGHLKSLIKLLLGSCYSLTELPQEICQLISLIILDLKNCFNISTLPSRLGDLKSLRRLCLDGTGITTLPESIMSLEKLKFLSVAGCRRLKFLPATASVGSVLLTSDGASSSSGDQGNLTRPSVGEGSNGLQYPLPQFPPSLTQLYAQGCYELEKIADVSNAKRLRELDLRFCPKLVDVPGVEQLKWLNSLKLVGCRSLYRSLRKRVQEAIFERLTHFSVSGSLNQLSAGQAIFELPDARQGQVLSFFVPKWFKSGSLYLKLGESSLHRVVVGIAITTTDDGRLLFSTTIPARVWGLYDYFGESDVPKVKLGEYGETMVMMHVLIKGCALLDGYLRSTTTDEMLSADIRENFGAPIDYFDGRIDNYYGLITVLSVDFS